MVWLATYCDNRRKFADCARYALAATGTEVPSSLMPNGTRTDMSWQDSRKQRWRDAIRAALKR